MKLFTQKQFTAYIIGLLLLFAFNGNAQHFGNVNGDPSGNQWTAYLDYVTIDNGTVSTPDAGDELGIFDGNTLVGVYEFNGNETNLDYNDGSASTGSGQTDYPAVSFSTLSNGNGYDPGNEISFKYWDESDGVEISIASDDIQFLEYDNSQEYVDHDGTPNFPSVSNSYSFMKLEFSSGYSVSGKVSLSGGCNGDVTNVMVSVYDNSGNLLGSGHPDANGDYEVGGIPTGNNFLLEATLDNYNPDNWTFNVSTNDRNQDLTLSPYQGSITVEVFNASSGDPINHATVDLYNANDVPKGSPPVVSSGEYDFTGLCMDDYYAEISHGSFVNETTSAVTLEEDGQSKTITVNLEPLPGSISGQVTDANTTDPISGAHVYAMNDNDEEVFHVTTNSQGNYEAAEVPAGTWDIVAEAAEYVTKTKSVQVNANSSNTENIVLTPSPGALEGTVRSSASNDLLSGVTVNVIGESTTPSTATSNGIGVYRFDEVPAGTHDVEFTKGDYESTTVKDVVINPNGTTTSDVYLDLEHGTIKVRLNNISDGSADVTINNEYEATYTGSSSNYYKFASIPPGEYDIDIEHPNKHNLTLEDVQVVSGETTYKEFDMVGYNWTFDGGSSWESIWTIYLQEVTVDGDPVEVTDEIAIFNSSDKMVGLYYVTSSINSGNATEHVLKAFEKLNDGSAGYTPGNQYSFKLYDQSKGTTLDLPHVTLSDPHNDGVFTGDVFPSGKAPTSFAKLEFFTSIDMTFNLESGYQFISSRLVNENMDMADIFSGGGIHGDLGYVKNEGGLQFWKVGNDWVNNIGDWQVTESYLVKMNNDFNNFTLSGKPVNPQKKIYLGQGYNLISYLPSSPMDADNAFNDIKDNLIFVRDDDGNHYWKIGNSWVNSLHDGDNNEGMLKPGEGYYVKMSANDSLIYPATTTKASTGTAEDQDTESQYFTFDGGDPTGKIYTVYIDSDNSLQKDDEVAVFDGEQMVGSTVITSEDEAMDNNLKTFSVIDEGDGFEPGNDIEFRVWSPVTRNEYTNVEAQYLNPHGDAYMDNKFPSDDGEYSIVKLSVSQLGLEDELSNNSLSVYPNPSDDVLHIESEGKISEIRVINTIGQVLIHERVDAKKHIINTSSLDSGIYMLETTVNGERRTLRFLAK